MAESDKIRLKWDHYRHNISETLCNVQKTKSYSDVTISCEGKLYRVHKLVLSMCSDYMDQLFQELEMTNSFTSNLVVILKDINGNNLEKLLDFVYAGEAQVLQSDLPDLIKAAEYLGIKGFSKSKESDTLKSKDLDISKKHESPIRAKRPTEEIKSSESVKKFLDERSEQSQESVLKETENISSHFADKDLCSQPMISPILSNNEDSSIYFSDTVNEEIAETNQDTEMSIHGSVTNENSEITFSEPNDPLDFDKIKKDDDEDDDSSDIFIEEEIDKPAIIPHFKPMDPQQGIIQNTPMINNVNQYQNSQSMPGTYGIQWMDFDGGHSIFDGGASSQTNTPSSSNVAVHSTRRRGAPVWIGFDDIGPGNERHSRLVKCKLCGIIKLSKGGTTTAMVQHIKVHHKKDGSGLCQKLEELEEKKRRKRLQRETLHK